MRRATSTGGLPQLSKTSRAQLVKERRSQTPDGLRQDRRGQLGTENRRRVSGNVGSGRSRQGALPAVALDPWSKALAAWGSASRGIGSHCEVFQAGGNSYSIRKLQGGGTGVKVWPAARELLKFLEQLRPWNGTRVVELGAGTGAVAIGLAKLGAFVYATDFDQTTIDNLQFNIDQNEVNTNVASVSWDWADAPPGQIPVAQLGYCVGSDLAFGATSLSLCKAISALKAATHGIECFFMLQEREGMAVDEFERHCVVAGMPVHRTILQTGVVLNEHERNKDLSDPLFMLRI